MSLFQVRPQGRLGTGRSSEAVLVLKTQLSSSFDTLSTRVKLDIRFASALTSDSSHRSLSPSTTMASSEPFTFVETTKDITKEGFESYVDILSAKVADVDIQFSSRLRSEYPEMILTTIPRSNIDLILFADLGYAFCEIDIKSDTVSRWRGYIPPDVKGNPGFLGEIINYARYKYKFGDEYFILYYVKFGYTALQYVLKEPRAGGETPNTTSSFTDKLIKAAGDVLYKQSKGIYVFDGYWYKDKKLYDQVQDSTWDKVILDENMKKDLTEVSEKFFDSKDIYDDLGVPWKRGIMFHGPPGKHLPVSLS